MLHTHRVNHDLTLHSAINSIIKERLKRMPPSAKKIPIVSPSLATFMWI